ncbi:MAG: FTR1 family iron permease [Saccharofermentanales bacterium]
MDSFIAGTILGFREGLEAFLIIGIILRYLIRIGAESLKKYVWLGMGIGILASVGLGGLLAVIGNSFGRTDQIAKVWESAASLFAMLLVTTFIIWMIRQSSHIIDTVENNIRNNISKVGIILVTSTMVAREGAEIAIFTFSGHYDLSAIASGILLSLILAVLIYFSLVKVNLKVIFKITLLYLILQAGYLLGYSIHEGLSALKDLAVLSDKNILYQKAFDLSATILNHKEGALGLPLNVLLGWYSKPEWLQLISQYVYTFGIFTYMKWYSKKPQNPSSFRSVASSV